jgi:putative transposase
MTLPRCVRAGTTLLVTRRCLLRMFLLRPSAVVEHVFSYCLAQAATRHGIEVHGFCVLSNHFHIVCTDVRGELPKFMEWLDGVVARALNVHYGRSESFWAPGSYSAVTLGDRDAILDKIAYTITNPVAAGLVADPAEWPGLISLPEHVGVRTVSATRPSIFFRTTNDADDAADGSARARRRRAKPAAEPLPDRASIAITKPRAFYDVTDAAYRRLLRAAVDEHLTKIRTRRAAEGLTGWLGAKKVLAQDPFDSPRPTSPDGSLNPRIACKDRWRRVQLLTTQRAFWQEYREARDRYRTGDRDVLFPPGTYWLRVQFGACCRPAA